MHNEYPKNRMGALRSAQKIMAKFHLHNLACRLATECVPRSGASHAIFSYHSPFGFKTSIRLLFLFKPGFAWCRQAQVRLASSILDIGFDARKLGRKSLGINSRYAVPCIYRDHRCIPAES